MKLHICSLNIREQLNKVLWEYGVTADVELLNAILALPSGLRAIDKDGNKRDIPIAEALEILKKITESVGTTGHGKGLFIDNGERVEVKGGA